MNLINDSESCILRALAHHLCWDKLGHRCSEMDQAGQLLPLPDKAVTVGAASAVPCTLQTLSSKAAKEIITDVFGQVE